MNAREARARADMFNDAKRKAQRIALGEILTQAKEYADRGDYWCPLRIERPTVEGVTPPDGTWLCDEDREELAERGFRFTHERWCEYGRIQSDGLDWGPKKSWWARFCEFLP